MSLQSPYNGSAFNPSRVNNFIPEVWSRQVRYNRDKELVAAQTVKKFSRPASYGDIIHIPLVDDFAVYDKQTESQVSLQVQSPGDYTITVDMMRESSFAVEDITKMFTMYDVKQTYMSRVKYALARDIDHSVLALRGTITPDNWLVSSSTGTVAGVPEPIDDDIILTAIETMQLRGVPRGEMMWLIGPEVQTQLHLIDKYISADYVSGRPTMTGEIGSLYGIRVVVSNNIVRNTSQIRNGSTGALAPIPGVAGSYWTPTQSPLQTTTGVGLPRGQTGNETAAPFITSLLVHPEWALWIDPIGGVKTETSRETLYLMDATVTYQIYGCKRYRDDHVLAIHTAP